MLNSAIMRYLLTSLIIAITFSSCQPRFADPEMEDRVELLENRLVKLEDQLRILRTTVNDRSYIDDTDRPNTAPQEPPVKPTTDAPRPRQQVSSGNSDSRRRSSQSSSSYSGRCQATTKKGTQCKRTSRSGGYCWQHGG